MKNKIEISVIIPTFNRKELLYRSISSVLNQDHKPYEIIIVDNGSNDDTESMIKKKFESVQYFYYESKGVSRARNFGIRKSKGNWICFLDSDDEWKKNKIKIQTNYITENKNIKFVHTNEDWYRNGEYLNQKKKHIKLGGYIFENCLKICCISPSSVMIKKELFNTYGFFDESLEVCEDYEMWLRISSKEEIGFINKSLVNKYGGHNDQLSKKFWGMDRFRVISIEKLIKNQNLNDTHKFLAINHLVKKIKIILNGAKKRKNTDIYNEYYQKLIYWKNYV